MKSDVSERSNLVREPLLHFVLLGAMLFVAGHYLETRDRRATITITQEQIQHLAESHRLQFGSPASGAQLEALIERWLQDEIFYREALALELDEGDEIIRRRLVQKYAFLRQDLVIPKEPAEAELANYYQEHRGRYVRPPRVTFTHVYFSPDARGDAAAQRAADELAADLNRRGLTRVVGRGDRFAGPHHFAALPPEEVQRVFGREGFAKQIFEVSPGRWSAPLRSGLGWHTVYVRAQEPGRQLTFAEARDAALRDYLDGYSARHNTEELQKLRRKFRIVRGGSE